MGERAPWRFWLIGLGTLILVLWALKGMLAPFLAGMAIAYLLDPLADRLERVKLPRWAATTVVLLAFAFAFVLVLLILVPVIERQVTAFITDWPQYREGLMARLAPLMERLTAISSQQDMEDLQSLIGQYGGDAVSWARAALEGIWRSGAAVVDLLSLLVITPVVAFYLLRDWDRMVAKIDAYLPRAYAPTIRALVRQVDATLSSFIRGQGTVCLILGVFYAVALSAAGLNFAVLVGLGSGLLSFIPFVGSIGGFLISSVIALVQFDDWTPRIVVMAIFVIGQAVEGNVLTPKLVGGSVGLHPVWVMFALLAGGSLFGFTGVLLAVPVAAVIGVLVRFGLERYRSSDYFRGNDPEAGAKAEATDTAVPPQKAPVSPRRKTASGRETATALAVRRLVVARAGGLPGDRQQPAGLCLGRAVAGLAWAGAWDPRSGRCRQDASGGNLVPAGRGATHHDLRSRAGA